MDHKKAFKKLGAFHDGALHSADAKAVSEHIAICAECSAEIEAIKQTDSVLFSAKHSSELDPYFSNRVINTVEKRKKAGFIPVKLLPIPVALAVFVVVFTAVMISSPFIYSADAETTGGDVKAMLLGAIIPDSPSKIFSPMNIIALCDSCNIAICSCCETNGTGANCPARRCLHEQK